MKRIYLIAVVAAVLGCGSPDRPAEPTEPAESPPKPPSVSETIAFARLEAFRIVVDRMRNGRTEAERYEAAVAILRAAQYRGFGYFADGVTTKNYREESER